MRNSLPDRIILSTVRMTDSGYFVLGTVWTRSPFFRLVGAAGAVVGATDVVASAALLRAAAAAPRRLRPMISDWQ